MTNTLMLKACIVLCGYTQKTLAQLLQISMQSLNKKIHNKSEFKASEINMLCSILKIENKQAIFFADGVDYKST